MIPFPMYFFMVSLATFTIAVVAQFSADSVRTWRAHRIAHYISVGHNVVAILMTLVMLLVGHDEFPKRLLLAAITSTLVMWRFWFVPLLVIAAIVMVIE